MNPYIKNSLWTVVLRRFWVWETKITDEIIEQGFLPYWYREMVQILWKDNLAAWFSFFFFFGGGICSKGHKFANSLVSLWFDKCIRTSPATCNDIVKHFFLNVIESKWSRASTIIPRDPYNSLGYVRWNTTLKPPLYYILKFTFASVTDAMDRPMLIRCRIQFHQRPMGLMNGSR